MKRAPFTIAFALTLCLAIPAHAKDPASPGHTGGRSGADAAAERAQRDTGGRVLAPPQQQGQGDYRVKILTPQGEVRYLNVDPRQDPKGRR